MALKNHCVGGKPVSAEGLVLLWGGEGVIQPRAQGGQVEEGGGLWREKRRNVSGKEQHKPQKREVLKVTGGEGKLFTRAKPRVPIPIPSCLSKRADFGYQHTWFYWSDLSRKSFYTGEVIKECGMQFGGFDWKATLYTTPSC